MAVTLLGEFEIRRRISPIADNSLASRAASDSWLAADESLHALGERFRIQDVSACRQKCVHHELRPCGGRKETLIQPSEAP